MSELVERAWAFYKFILIKYVLVYQQPTLRNNGETPFKHQIDELRAKGNNIFGMIFGTML